MTKEMLYKKLMLECLNAYRTNRDSASGIKVMVYLDPETGRIYTEEFSGEMGIPASVFDGKDIEVACFSDYDEPSGAGFLDAVFEELEERIVEELDTEDDQLMEKIAQLKEKIGLEAYEQLFPEIYEEKLNEMKEEDEERELENIIQPVIQKVLNSIK